jgi:ABC transport system ATP-binding/permease protein
METNSCLKHFSIFMQKGMRVGIVGPNGCGKSTLLRVLMGTEPPQGGEILVGQATRFLYVDQTLADMNPEERVLDFVSDGQRIVEVGKQRIHVPSYLESFLFDKSCAEMPLGRLSGGERRRVDLAKKLLRGGNFLVLDEPTNDLDLFTLRVLEETIETFEGCALIVSHDRYLLNRLCTHMLVFEEEGTVVQITGNYNDYMLYCDRRRQDAKEERQLRLKQDRSPATAPIPRPGLTYKEKQELADMESAIQGAEQQVACLREEITRAGFYEQAFTITQQVLKRLEEAEAEVERLYDRWEELEHKVEGGNGNYSAF